MVKKVNKKNSKEEDKRLRAFITTFFSLIGFIIALIIWRDDKYTMFYAKQSIVIFGGWVIAGIISGIKYVSWIGSLFAIVVLIFWFASWINALSGKKKELPIVDDITVKFNL